MTTTRPTIRTLGQFARIEQGEYFGCYDIHGRRVSGNTRFPISVKLRAIQLLWKGEK